MGVVEFLEKEWNYRPSGVMSARAERSPEERKEGEHEQDDLVVDVALLNFQVHHGPLRIRIFANAHMIFHAPPGPGIYMHLHHSASCSMMRHHHLQHIL